MKTSSRVENLTQPRQGQIIFEIVLVVDIEIRPDLLSGESFYVLCMLLLTKPCPPLPPPWAPLVPLGPPCSRLGTPLAPLGSLLDPLGSCWAPFGSPLDSLGGPWAPLGSLWAPLGSPPPSLQICVASGRLFYDSLPAPELVLRRTLEKITDPHMAPSTRPDKK